MNIDKKELKTANNYAKALLEITKAQNSSLKIYEEFKALIEVLETSKDLKLFLENPLISPGDKKEIIYKVFGKDFDIQIINLLNLLADNKRLSLVDTVYYCYEQLYEKDNNISEVTVISAVKMDEDDKNRLKEILEKKLGGNIIPDFEISEDILGGLIVKIQDRIVDLSLKSKINDMEKQLI